MGMIQIPFGHGSVSYIEPHGSPNAYKTYSMRFPLKTHWRKATCEEAGCEAYQFGFATTVDTGTELGQKQYYYLTHDRERTYTMQHVGATLYKFVFPPGQRCFKSSTHRVRLERTPTVAVTPGDFRAFTGPPRIFQRVDDWVDDFANHQDRVNILKARG